MMSDCGINGVLLTWVDYVDGLIRFNQQVLPRLEQLGLRHAFKSKSHLSAGA